MLALSELLRCTATAVVLDRKNIDKMQGKVGSGPTSGYQNDNIFLMLIS
jgi:hypothetical protein